MTPFGGMVVLLEFLNKIGFVKKVIECMPVTHLTEFDSTSTNLYRLSDFGGGESAALRADHLAARR